MIKISMMMMMMLMMVILDEHQILSVDFHEVLNAAASASELVVWIQLSHDQSWSKP